MGRDPSGLGREVLTVGSLFSGIEGFGLGFGWAGLSLAWHVETDKDCRQVIQRHWAGLVGPRDGTPASGGREPSEQAEPSSRLFGDVRTVGAHNLSAVDLVCGGFPCQDLSVAGRRAGLAGERSGLWHEFHRILAELRPRWVVIENVPGLLSSNEGRDMAVVLAGLAELGYGWAYRVLDAQFFGVAQRRRRVFIVGCLGDTARAVQVLFEPESCDGDSPPSRQAREDIAAGLTAGAGTNRLPRPGSNSAGAIAHTLSSDGADASEDGTGRGTPLVVQGGAQQDQFMSADGIAPTLAHSSNTHSGHHQPWIAPMLGGGNYGQGNLDEGLPMMVRTSSAVRRLTPVECERLQGFPDGWTAGLSDSARYRMLGNAVCVPVAHWIGVRITNVVEATRQ